MDWSSDFPLSCACRIWFETAYAPVRDYLGAGPDAPFYMKFLAGAITGGVGSVIGNPFDVLKVRKNELWCDRKHDAMVSKIVAWKNFGSNVLFFGAMNHLRFFPSKLAFLSRIDKKND